MVAGFFVVGLDGDLDVGGLDGDLDVSDLDVAVLAFSLNISFFEHEKRETT